MRWRGVFAAITTPFREDLSVDQEAVYSHTQWLIDQGVQGVVPLGSLGESSTLTTPEKKEILRTNVAAAKSSGVPVVAGIASLSTSEAIELAGIAEGCGCDGLMVLPPLVYRGDEREVEAYFSAVFDATALPCMLYNNPIAYGNDVLPAGVANLARRHANLQAVKESSGNVQRVSEIRSLLGDRVAIFCGVDDAIVETLHRGGVGWIAGLVNALPAESVRLFNLITGGDGVPADPQAGRALFDWFLPLLQLDAQPKFVQLIKLVQSEVGRGSARVRPPRLELEGEERQHYLRIIREGLAGARITA